MSYMNKKMSVAILGILLVLIGIYLYKSTMDKQKASQAIMTGIAPTAEPLSSPLSFLITWVPDATWGTPQHVTEDTPYGKLKGVKVEGAGKTARRNFEDTALVESWGYKPDMGLSADGPGASNWGYSKTDKDGKTQIFTLGYSTGALMGPESKTPSSVSLFVFVSDPFTKK